MEISLQAAEAAYAIEQLTSDIDIKTNARLLDDLEDAVVAVRAALIEPEAEVAAGASLS